MTERPGDDDAGYPPAPTPRAEPYTVDDAPAAEPPARAPEEVPAPEQPVPAEPVPEPVPEQPVSEQPVSEQPVPEQPVPEPQEPTTAPGPLPLTWSSPGPRSDQGVPPRDAAVPDGGHEAPSGYADSPGGRRTPGERHDARAEAQWAPPPRPAEGESPRPPQHAPSTWPTQRPHTALAGYPPAAPPSEFGAAGASTGSPAAPWPWPGDGGRPWQSVNGSPTQLPEPSAAPERRRRRRTVGLGVVVLLVLVSLLGGIVLGALGARQLFPGTASSLPGPSGQSPVDRAPDSVAAIAAASLESTVYIEVAGGGVGSSGSGMVLREDGYVVTNNHVIAPAAGGDGGVTVTFADGGQERAEIVGRTADYDLAVLKVERDGLTPLPLADSDAVVVGDTAIAVGAPLGLEGTVTTGIISALNRPVQAGAGSDGASSFINAIQTDAAINPGNSGGPLINGAGEVIGINTAIAQTAGQQTGSIGLGFAIPANQVRRTAEQIIETGRATYPVIGVALDTRHQGEGVRVIENGSGDTAPVTPGGPGDRAGIAPGDVITRFDGQPVTSPQELIVAVRSRAPGDTVVLTVRSAGEAEREVEVVLDEAGSD